jgi:hypothetical protein
MFYLRSFASIRGFYSSSAIPILSIASRISDVGAEVLFTMIENATSP